MPLRRRLPWFRYRRGPAARARSRPVRRGTVLSVEPLEDRSLLATLTFTSPDPPQRLPPGTHSTGVLQAELDVQPYAVIRDLSVHLDIRHDAIGEVQAVLFAPDGSRIVLFQNVGGDGADFHATLDDQATSLVNDGVAPFAGSFQPLDSLDRLVGTDVHGSWLLELTDTGEQGTGFLDGWSLTVETADPIVSGTPASGTLDTTHPADHYVFQVDTPGLLTVEAAPAAGSTLDPQATLSNSDSLLLFGKDRLRIGTGGLQATSDDRAPGDPRPLLQQYVLPGTWYVDVAAVGGTSGGFTATTTLTPGPNPYLPGVTLPSLLQVGDNPQDIVAADFNDDGVLDLATANRDSGDVSVLLGGGDASFLPQLRFAVGGHPDRLAVTDFNHDGRADLLVLDTGAQAVTVLLGVGDGTFRAPGPDAPRLAAADPRLAGLFGDAHQDATGDFNRDGAVPDQTSLVPSPDDPSRFENFLNLSVAVPTQADAFIDLRTLQLRSHGGDPRPGPPRPTPSSTCAPACPPSGRPSRGSSPTCSGPARSSATTTTRSRTTTSRSTRPARSRCWPTCTTTTRTGCSTPSWSAVPARSSTAPAATPAPAPSSPPKSSTT